MSPMSDHLDDAYDALRAWCHTRPDVDDPSTIYGALGSIAQITLTLAHIVDVIPVAASSATGSDDGRRLAEAWEEIRSLSDFSLCALHEASQAVSGVHEIVAHLVFAVGDEA